MKKDLFSTPENLTARQKKILFRAWHRGTREADLLLGRFADHYISTADEVGQDAFEMLLAQSDPDLYDWVSCRIALPVGGLQPLLQEMIAFYAVTP